MYDIAIIGAGISGSSVAYELKQHHKNLIVFDGGGVGSGGSGAAGAFIAPKFSKKGELKEILHDAFLYAIDFYTKNFPHLFTKTQLLHLAKDQKDAEILRYYKQNTPLKLYDVDTDALEYVSIDAGIVKAKEMCEAMLDGVEFVKKDVKTLYYTDGYWNINDTFKAKSVVLATGAYEGVIKEPYINLRGIWGHRIDIATSTQNPYSIHQFVSISPSQDFKVAIGATHNVFYHPQKTKEPYNLQEGRDELLQKASKTIKLEDVKILKDYVGLRSGSFDYIPIVGKILKSDETLKKMGKKIRVKKPNTDEFVYHQNLYMVNGSAGYGFVLAPYLANILKNHLIDKTDIDDILKPERFFIRAAKKGLL